MCWINEFVCCKNNKRQSIMTHGLYDCFWDVKFESFRPEEVFLSLINNQRLWEIFKCCLLLWKYYLEENDLAYSFYFIRFCYLINSHKWKYELLMIFWLNTLKISSIWQWFLFQVNISVSQGSSLLTLLFNAHIWLRKLN